MSSITAADGRYIEAILDMSRGYVLHFTDATFGDFFNRYNIDIHGPKYQAYGTSKAKKMRAFMEKEADPLVGRVLSELLDSYVANCELGGREPDTIVLAKCREIVSKLLGVSQARDAVTAEGFLNKEFEIPNIQKLAGRLCGGRDNPKPIEGSTVLSERRSVPGSHLPLR